MVVTAGQGRSGAEGVECIEATDAAKNLAMNRTAPVTKNYLAQNVDSAEVKKPWFS